MAKLYDAFGRPIEYPSKPSTVSAALAVRDAFQDGTPSRGLTPRKLAAIFTAANEGDIYSQMELFEEMEEKDTHLLSCVGTRKLAVARLDWRLRPASDQAADKKLAEEITERIKGIFNFRQLMLDALDAIGKGFSAVELTWKVGPNGADVERGDWVHQRCFAFGEGRRLQLRDESGSDLHDLVPRKFIVHQYQAKSGHPARGGIYRVAAWAYLFRNYTIKDWLTFAEVYGMPMRIGKYDPSASKEDKDALKTAVQMLGTDAAGVISKATEIDLVKAIDGGKGGDVYNLLYQSMGREISKAILGQTLTVDTSGSTGTYSAGKVHDEVRDDLRDADAEALADTLQRDLVVPLVGFNHGWDAAEHAPQFELVIEEPEDLKDASDWLSKLVKDVGVKVPVKWLHEKFGVPIPKDGEDVYQGQAGAPKGNAEENSLGPLAQVLLTASSQDKTNAAAIESVVEASTGQAATDTHNTMRELLQIIQDADSYEQAFERLAQAYPALDLAQVRELLARSMFNSEMFGRALVHDGE